VAAVAILVSGVTYAALQSQQTKLTGNTIQTATANLQISQDGTAYAASQGGFAFTNLVPGGPALPVAGYSFFLKNAGGAPLTLKLAVSSTPSNVQSVDLTKVHVILTAIGASLTQNFTLQSLIDAAPTGGLAINLPASMLPSSTQPFAVAVSMDSDAVNGSSASISNLDFSFTGVVSTS